jgi:MFS family permease
MSRAEVFRYRNFVLLWVGQTVSVTGNGLFTVALPLEVLHLTGSSFELSLVVAARTLPPLILLLVGGTLVDRLSRRAVMLVSDATSGVALAMLTLLIVTHRERVQEIFILSVVLGSATAFFRPASATIIRDIVPSNLLVSANSLSSLSRSLGLTVLGPLIGGAIVAMAGYGWAFGIDAGSFAASAVCLAAMRNITEVRAVKERITSGMLEGIRHCRSQRWLWWSMIALGVANIASFTVYTIMQPLLVRNIFHEGAVAVGIMIAAGGIGRVVASITASRRNPPHQRMKTTWLAWTAFGTCCILMGLSPWLGMAVACFGVMRGVVAYGDIIWLSTVQEETPPTLLGRVSSIDWLFSLSLTPLGTIAGGVAVLAIGVRLTVVACGAITAASGAVLFIPGVTDLDKRRAREAQPAAPAATTAD